MLLAPAVRGEVVLADEAGRGRRSARPGRAGAARPERVAAAQRVGAPGRVGSPGTRSAATGPRTGRRTRPGPARRDRHPHVARQQPGQPPHQRFADPLPRRRRDVDVAHLPGRVHAGVGAPGDGQPVDRRRTAGPVRPSARRRRCAVRAAPPSRRTPCRRRRRPAGAAPRLRLRRTSAKSPRARDPTKGAGPADVDLRSGLVVVSPLGLRARAFGVGVAGRRHRRRSPVDRTRAGTSTSSSSPGEGGDGVGLRGLAGARPCRPSPALRAPAPTSSSTSSMIAIGAASPLRGPVFTMRV